MMGSKPPAPPPPPTPATRADASRSAAIRPQLIGGQQRSTFLASQPARTGGRRSLLGAAS